MFCKKSIFAFASLFIMLMAACASNAASPIPAEPPTPTASPFPTPAERPMPTASPFPTLEIVSSDEKVFDAKMGLPFRLEEGQTARIASEGLKITFVQILEDTRCPGRTDCESPGELRIEYRVVKNGRDLGLFALGSNSGGRVIDNYVISIWDYDGETVMVQPYAEEMARTTFAENLAHCTEGRLSTYFNPDPPASQVHVIGIYQTGQRYGVANIYVEREGAPLILVLSAYQPTVWRIHPAEGVIIEQIILNGEGQHQVVVDGDVPVVDRSGGYWEGYIVASADRWGDDDTTTLVSEVEAMTGVPITAFYGCYEGSEFTIPADPSPSSE